MSATFSVKNFEKFQHYSDRTPPWIKLYNALLDNYDYSILPDASKSHLIGIWLLASRSKNILPLDQTWVSRKIGATVPVDLTILRDAGFIVFNHACSEMLAPREQSACLEREREGEREKEKEDTSDFQSDPSKPVLKKGTEPHPGKRKTPYPEAFESFWREYPTDALMSKKAAFSCWNRLDPESRDAARAAIPAFKAYCQKNPTYRPVHAERFLRERRFDGFNASPTLSFKITNEQGWRDRLRIFHDKSLWSSDWGPRPGETGCKCPQEIIDAASEREQKRDVA